MKENYYELQQSLTSWQRQKCSPFTNTEGTIWIDLTAFKQEITKWRHHWSIGPPDDPLPETLVETLDQTNAAFYAGIYVAVTTLLTFPISACAAECSFSSMKRLKTSLRKTMTDERLSSLAILQYMLWFGFILGLNFISFCFKLVIIHYRTRKQREIKFEPSIKLNHNIFINTKMLMLITSQSLNLRNKRGGASPWACKHSSKSSKKNVLKAVFDITSCRKQGCKLPRYVLKVSKNVILYEVFETIWTRVRTYQNVYSTPLKGGRK